MRLIYVNSSKVTKLEQKMNNSESFLLLLKNLLKCTYEVLLPSQRNTFDCCYIKIVIWLYFWPEVIGLSLDQLMELYESLRIRTLEILLAHLSQRLIGELIVYPCSGVRCRTHTCDMTRQIVKLPIFRLLSRRHDIEAKNPTRKKN